MATTGTYIVYNPTSGTHYVAPQAYWVVPSAGTSVNCTIQSFDGSGNLLAETSLTAIERNITHSSDAGSYTGAGANTTRSVYSNPNGSDVFAAAGYVVGSPASIRMYLTYTGTAYDQTPNPPSSLSPNSNAIITTLTPVLTGNFNAVTSGDTLSQYEVQVQLANGTQVWDSGVVNATSAMILGGQFSSTYASGTALVFGSSYQWRARTSNQNGLWSGYSGFATFTVQQGPNIPGSVLPSGQQSTTTPTWSFAYSSPAAVGMQAYHWWITSPSGGVTVFDNGFVTFASASGTTITSAISAGVGLQPGHSYIFNVVARDTNSAVSPTASVAFSIAPLPQATPSSPINNSTANSNTPTFAWTYSDPNYTQATYEIQVVNKATQALLFDTGFIASAATSATIAVITNPVAAPVPTAAAGSTALLAGTYTVAYSYTDAGGETQISPTANVAITAGQQISVAAISLPANATGIKYYLSIAAGSATLGVSNTSTGGITILTVVGNGTRPPSSNTSNFIGYNTSIQWRIQVTDTAGLASGWSAYAFAIVNNAPQAAIIFPANSSTITNNAPTVTWTYTASTGGQLQASASVALQDANGNTLQTYSVTGAGTSFALPVGVLQNNTNYKLLVTVTDTASQIGQSPVIAFLLLYTPPADIQGQPLTSGHNYILQPHLMSDGGTGIASGWSSFVTTGQTYASSMSIDPNILEPVNTPTGDGPFEGGQLIQVTSIAGGAGFIDLTVYQRITMATAGWTAGVTFISAMCWLQLIATSGVPQATMHLTFRNSSFATISYVVGPNQRDTSGAIVQYLGPQNQLIPASTVYVDCELKFDCPTPSDLGSCWFMMAQVEAAAASDANFIAGDLGTGYSYDANNYSVRSLLAGNAPTLVANPGAATDPLSALGGSLTFSWDQTLADATRFVQYLIERRRQDQSENDNAWVLLATITNKAINSYTDFTAGGNTVYQYGIRQQITYPADGATGVSANRAIIIGSVNYSPAWYLVNGQGTLYNVRLNVIDTKRKLKYAERAVYSDFLGRVGTARDAGPAAGYAMQLIVYFNDSWGDNRAAIRRQFVAMQNLNVLWYLKDPEGLVIPVWFQDPDFDEQDFDSDTLMTVTLNFLQAQDTTDY